MASKYIRCPVFPCNVKIYRLYWDEFPEDVGYVGHTRKRLLSQRMTGHRTNSKTGRKRGKNALVHQKIRERPPFQYELLEIVFCQDFDEARKYEKHWKVTLKANLNMHNPFRTKEERRVQVNNASLKYNNTPNGKEINKKREARRQAKPGYKQQKATRDAKPERVIRRKKSKKEWGEKCKREKRFSCEVCEYYAMSGTHLRRHLKSKSHLKILS